MSGEDVAPMPDGAVDTRQVALPERLAREAVNDLAARGFITTGFLGSREIATTFEAAIRAALDAAKAEALRGSAPHVAAAIEAL